MKNVVLLGLLTGIMIAFTGCHNSVLDYTEVRELSFRPIYSHNTRSEEADTELYAKNLPFGVWAYTLPLVQNWKQHSAQSLPFLQNSQIAWSANQWSTVTKSIWPRNQHTTFFAYSPYAEGVKFSRDRGIQFNHIDLQKDTNDYLFCSPITDQTQDKSGGVVQVPFIHAYCAVRFCAQTVVPDNIQIRVRKLNLSNVYTSGSFHSLPDPEWSTEGTAHSWTVYDGDLLLTSESQNVGVTMNMIPQTLETTVDVVCDITIDGKTLPGQTLSANAKLLWGVGKLCIYTMKLSVTNMTFTTDILNK